MAVMLPNQAPQYVGTTLTTRERNYHDDSDFYAVVWDEADGQVKCVDYGTTRFCWMGDATTDATPDIVAKANAWAQATLRDDIRKALEADARKVRIGDEVRTTVSRGKNKGFTGEVVSIAPNPFRSYYRGGYNKPEHNMQVKVRLLDGSYRFWALENVERLVVPAVTDEEVEAKVAKVTWSTWLACRTLSSGLLYV